MRHLARALIVFGTVGFSGCASLEMPARVPSRCADVHAGMTFAQVDELLGPPVKKFAETQTASGALAGYRYARGEAVQFLGGKAFEILCGL